MDTQGKELVCVLNKMEEGQKKRKSVSGSCTSDSDTSKSGDELSRCQSAAAGAGAAKDPAHPVMRNKESVEWQQSLQDAWRISLADFDSVDVFQGNERNVVGTNTESDTHNNTEYVTSTTVTTGNVTGVEQQSEQKPTIEVFTTMETHTAQVKMDDVDCKPQEAPVPSQTGQIICVSQSTLTKTDDSDGQQEHSHSVQGEETVLERTVSPQTPVTVQQETARIYTQRTYKEAQEQRRVIRIARSASIEVNETRWTSEGDSNSEYSGMCSEEESGGGAGGAFRGLTRSISIDRETNLKKGSASSSRSSNIDQTGVLSDSGETSSSKGIKFAMADWKSSRQSSVQQITVKAKTLSRTMSIDNTLERRYAATMERHIKELKSK